MLDIVIVTVPGTLTRSPPAAPAILKASIINAGFSCKTIDFNIRFYNTVDKESLVELENYFSTELNQQVEETAAKLVESWAKEISDLQTKYVGISVFTYQNRKATELLCKYLRKYSQAKIIIGGQGIVDGGILGKQGFAKNLLDKKLIDYYIKSEGERSLVELLKGNINYLGINSNTFDQIDDLDSLPLPDYSDYILSEYNFPTLPITFSRGCVRSCSFCDIHEHWKYKFRSGKSVANEIINLHNHYGVSHFSFTDSLVNGNLKEFKIFCKKLSEYNSQNKKRITWTGQYIVRGEKQLSLTYWKDLSNSGATQLAIGVETGSDSVRKHMNKGFSNSDLDYTMDMLDKNNITCVFLMIVGYPTETNKDFEDTLDMFDRYKHLANRIIADVNIGSTLGILPGTPLFTRAGEFHIELDTHENNWIAADNPLLTLQERIRRVNALKDYLQQRNYYVNNDAEGILKILEENIPRFEKKNLVKKMIKIKEIL